uniref:CCHC-type domain-containing protein n=1 Tax=Arundo donax TaxID=35708 RepID=A0A0A9AVB8_ARUDO
MKPPSSKPEDTTTSKAKVTSVVCYNCLDAGHFSVNCPKKRICFICHEESHLASNCPEWLMPHKCAEYLGSANRGLGFFHVDVAERPDRKCNWENFENCAVITIEEGDISQEELVDNLKMMFEKNWDWSVRPMEEYKYLVRFPHLRSCLESFSPRPHTST